MNCWILPAKSGSLRRDAQSSASAEIDLEKFVVGAYLADHDVSPRERGRSVRPQDQAMSEWMMFQFRHLGPPPTASEVAKRFGLADADMDQAAGISVTDPVDGLYVVMVRQAAAAKVEHYLRNEPADPAVGIFANPRIEPSGRPR
jgi:hypothetical protein